MTEALQVYHLELFLFYVFALGTVFLPLRLGLLCLLLGGCVEVVAPGFVAASSIGWENVAARFVLPSLLLLRILRFRLPNIRWRFPAKAWGILILYAAISAVWSPFKLSALKMVAYLAAWFILYLVFDLAWHRSLIDQKLIMFALWGSLALACLQTYALGNPLWGIGVYFGPFASPRFAPFTGPQSFGPFLACLFGLLLFSKERCLLRSFSIAACLAAIVLTGSRYSLIEVIILVGAWSLLWFKAVRRGGSLRLARVAVLVFVAGTIFLGFRVVMVWAMPESRINQLLEVGVKADVTEVGTFGDRLLLYSTIITDLIKRSPMGIAFGTGTSSGGQIALVRQLHLADQMNPAEGVDPNRTIHDEFLRALYEWGFVGLGIGLALITCAVRGLWTRAFRLRSLAGFAGLAIMPGIILALLVENPLAGPGSAESYGYLLVLTYGFAFSRKNNSPRRTEPDGQAWGQNACFL